VGDMVANGCRQGVERGRIMGGWLAGRETITAQVTGHVLDPTLRNAAGLDENRGPKAPKKAGTTPLQHSNSRRRGADGRTVADGLFRVRRTRCASLRCDRTAGYANLHRFTASSSGWLIVGHAAGVSVGIVGACICGSFPLRAAPLEQNLAGSDQISRPLSAVSTFLIPGRDG